ncbi:zinc-dependent alcohol dehydrogenase [Gulosibacter sediminis]|uniref:zinc-dependent alcohol dehydrogenase n=1 Tax=Gulosibacter sediminis TaxID=1729695 RepID=UPI0024A963A9|nr:alcohol dehydrogenase catalytic domain-containing protein [Gulosibacter sediminis]
MATEQLAARLRSRTPWDLVIDRVVEPSPAAGEVRIRTEAVGLCGSDVHAVRADAGYEWVPENVVIGHEVVGVVDAVGHGIDATLVGRRVVPIAIDGCGHCAVCRTGHTNRCLERNCMGMHFDGGLAESFVFAADRLHVLAEQSLDARLAALIEPMAVAHQALRGIATAFDTEAAGIEPLRGVELCVSGPGAVGLLAGCAALAAGANVTISGPPSGAESRMAAALALSMRADAPGREFDAWLDASGAGVALRGALPRVRRGGVIGVPAMFAAEVALDMNAIVRGQLTLRGSYAYTREDFVAAERIVGERADALHAIVEEFTIAETVTALRAAADATVVKPVVVFSA